MSDEHKMTNDERYKYLQKMQERYVQSDRKEPARLLARLRKVAQASAELCGLLPLLRRVCYNACW
jgi:hypothetical protein